MDFFVAGDFSLIGELAVNHIARWDGATWQSHGDGIDGPVSATALGEPSGAV